MSRRALVRVAVVFGLMAAGSAVTPTNADANAPALGTDDTIEVQVAGEHGVPSDAVAAVLNVTAVDATAQGFLTMFPCDAVRPDASNVNFVSGVAVANLV